MEVNNINRILKFLKTLISDSNKLEKLSINNYLDYEIKTIYKHKQEVEITKKEIIKNRNLSMLIYEEFKKILVKEVISDDFCVLKTTDTLAQAFTLIILNNINSILIVDHEYKYMCNISDISILGEVPPQLASIPLKYQAINPNRSRAFTNFVLNKTSKTLDEVFDLETFPCHFYDMKDNFHRCLEELAKPHILTNQKIIPILNKDRNIEGIVSTKEMLKYIFHNYSNFSFMKTTLKKAFLERYSACNLYTLFPEDTLAFAYFSIKYISTDFILICDIKSRLLGIVNERKITEMNHYMYDYLADMPVSEIMDSVNNYCLMEPENNLEEAIINLLNKEIDNIILVENKLEEINPLCVINVTNILDFFSNEIK